MSWLREPNAEPIPGYRLIEPLGSGGFGEVWRCEAPGGLHKAIKFVYGNLNSLDIDAVRAEQELHALQRIKEVRHPFVCSLDRIEIVQGELVIVMELAEKTMHDLFKECQDAGLIGIPRDDLLRYLRDTAEALDHMNEKHKLQHLDIKPRNLFLICDRVKVADFGLVKHLERLSSSGLLGGVTPLYAPPETFNGKISEHSDQYSLAIVYQEMLTGHRPFSGKNVRQLAQQHMQAEPDLRALPEGDRPIVLHALAKDPNKRFDSCMEFIRALYTATTPVRAPGKSVKDLVSVGEPARPRTLADTMEDFQLEEPPEEVFAEEEAVDLGAPAVPPDRREQELLEVSDMGVTVAAPDTGALRPTLFIGLGNFGRKGLLELRCRFVDRFGDLSKVPMLRFLCFDPDPEAVNIAVRGAPEVALSRNEVYHLPLQPVSNYRRRIIDQLADWLPREKLYAMPRSLQTQGSRALGRLAFVDNHQRLLARIRREIQEITNPEIIYESVSSTGLALRDTTPRVYIIASGGGGSSGMLVDLGYALRRQLSQMRHHDAEMNLFLMCSAPNDPASPKHELANVHATLTEINHFSDPSIPFAAEYGVDGHRIVEQGAPFGSVYLMPMAHRSPDALEDVVAHLGSYISHEISTPLGIRLGNIRHEHEHAPDFTNVLSANFRSMGTYAVWFPRGLLLRLAARLACRRLIGNWMAKEEEGLVSNIPTERVVNVCQVLTQSPQLAPEAIAGRIQEVTRRVHLTDLGGTPVEAITNLLANLDEQAANPIAMEDPGHWARQALTRVRDWVGAGEPDDMVADWRKTRINRALHMAGAKVAEEYIAEMAPQLYTVMEHPGARMASAEEALDLLEEYCSAQVEKLKEKQQEHKIRTGQCWSKLDAALTECFSGTGSFRLWGGRSNRRLLQNFMERLSAFARQRLQEELTAAVEHFFVALRGQFADQKRDLGFCRQRLRHLQESLEYVSTDLDEDLASTRPGAEYTVTHSPLPSAEAYWEAIRQSNTARVVLPENEEDLERAAIKLLHRLKEKDWKELDKELDDRVLKPRGGLHVVCMNSGDLTRALAVPLMDETIRLLGEHLPIMDVAQILGAEYGFTFDDENTSIPDHPELAKYTKGYLDRAYPLLGEESNKSEHAFLLVPASKAGKTLGQSIIKALPELNHVKVPGQSDLMFCRDHGPLQLSEMQQVIKQCGLAYEQAASAPTSSPHARFDIIDWMPLDP